MTLRGSIILMQSTTKIPPILQVRPRKGFKKLKMFGEVSVNTQSK
jgi:hypothetical protein